MCSPVRAAFVLLLALGFVGGCAGGQHVVDADVLRARAAHAQPDSAYVRALIARSRTLKLGHDVQWLRLGHYRSTGAFSASFDSDVDGSNFLSTHRKDDPQAAALGRSYESDVDGPNFFLSPRGKIDPQAELEATIRAFFVAPDATLKEPTICHYPARFAFLLQHLGFDLQRLKLPACEAFVKFVSEANPESVTLVFSSYYLNNPASAFGHTFLRLNKAGTMVSGERRELLDYAIEFSADVDTGNAIIYALKGLLGGFPGTVKRMPFYYKVRKYADYESRDMWEYELSFTPQELYMLLAHIWEVGHTYFDYYYLSENCSYRILLLLEAAKPSLHLTEQLMSPVLPTDTVKALFDNPGFVRDVKYRPSARTRFEHDVKGLTSEQKALVEDLADDAELPLPEALPKSEQVQVLDAAADLVDLRALKKILVRQDPVAAERKRRLLERRAALGLPSPQTPLEPPWNKAAERGHGSKRLGISGGYREPSAGFVAFDFRLAMHDLADPSDGYPDLSQIEFMPTRLRVYPHDNGIRLTLDDFSVVSVVSLNSLSRFDLSPSWRFSIGARTLEHEGCTSCLAAKFRLGAGAAFAFADQAITLFLTLDTWVFSGPDLSGIADSVVRVGVGPSPGLRIRFEPNLIWLLSGDVTWYPGQADQLIWQADSVLRFSYLLNQALSLELRARRDRKEAQLFALTYF